MYFIKSVECGKICGWPWTFYTKNLQQNCLATEQHKLLIENTVCDFCFKSTHMTIKASISSLCFCWKVHFENICIQTGIFYDTRPIPNIWHPVKFVRTNNDVVVTIFWAPKVISSLTFWIANWTRDIHHNTSHDESEKTSKVCLNTNLKGQSDLDKK